LACFCVLESHSYGLNNQMKVWLSKEVGTGDGFVQDMLEHCYLLKKEMEERDQLIGELEKLAVSSDAAKYVQILRRRQERDGVKLVAGVVGLCCVIVFMLVARRHLVVVFSLGNQYLEIGRVWVFFAFSLGIWLGDSTPSLPDSLGPSVVVVTFLPTDSSSRTCAAGDFMVSAAGSASNGSVTGCKTASKVKFGYPGLACCPKWYSSVCVNTVGRWLVSLSSVVFTIVLQSGTNVCASGLKHVTVAVAVPSLIIALKQYICVNVMTLLDTNGNYVAAMDVVFVVSFTLDRSVGLMSAMLMDVASTNGNFCLSVGTIFGSLASVIELHWETISIINEMRGKKTFSDIRVPVMMRASMTLLRSWVTINRVPLQRPRNMLRFRRSIFGAPTFSSSMYGGKPAKFSEFRYSTGCNSSVSPPSFPCGTASSKLRSASAASEYGIHNSGDYEISLPQKVSKLAVFFMRHIDSSSKFSGIWKHECAVLADGNNNAAIPDVATVRTIFSSERKVLMTVFHRNVFPVPPCPYTNMSFCALHLAACVISSNINR
nr:hypothetical protein [Tanacetum cinerariifolium]